MRRRCPWEPRSPWGVPRRPVALVNVPGRGRENRTGTPWPSLDDQDTGRWDRSLIADGEALLRRAHALGAPLGRFPIEAAIQSAHCDRLRSGTTDRATIVHLYRGLMAIASTAGAGEALAALTSRSGPWEVALG